jgi:hypothetical protein
LTREDIINAARSYIGVRWEHQGRTRNGLDCIGLLVCIAKDIGIEPVDFKEYRRVPDGHVFRQKIVEQTDPGERNDIKTGSILLVRQTAYPCHVQFASMGTLRNTVIHASLIKRKVVEEPMEDFLRYVIAVREFPGVE